MTRGTLETPETLLEGFYSQNYFANTKTLFAVLTLILSQVYSQVFQRPHDVILQQNEFRSQSTCLRY